jgi:hypothetical protein
MTNELISTAIPVAIRSRPVTRLTAYQILSSDNVFVVRQPYQPFGFTRAAREWNAKSYINKSYRSKQKSGSCNVIHLVVKIIGVKTKWENLNPTPQIFLNAR